MLDKRTLHIRCCPVCNLKCPYCFSIDRQRGVRRDFPLEVLDWIFERYSFTEFVMLCGEGETTLCPNFEEVVERCLKSPTPQLQILTNGMGRNLDWWKEFVDRYRKSKLLIGFTWHPSQGNLKSCLDIADYIYNYIPGQTMWYYIKTVVTWENIDEVVDKFEKMTFPERKAVSFHFDYTNREEEASVRTELERRLSPAKLDLVHVEVCGDERYLSDWNQDSVAVTLEDKRIFVVDRNENWEDKIVFEGVLNDTV